MVEARVVKRGVVSFRAQQREKVRRQRALSRARIQARKIKKAGGKATAQLIGGEAVVIETKAPELFDIKGDPAKPKTVTVEGKRQEVIEGFTRADVTRLRALREASARASARERERIKKETSKIIASRLPSGQILKKLEKPSIKELTTEAIIQTLPTARVISKVTELPGPTRKKVEEKDIKPIIIPKTKRITKIERVVSKKLGLKKVAKKVRELQEEKVRSALADIKRIQKDKDIDPRLKKFGVILRKADITASEIGLKFIDNILNKPVQNAGLVLASAGITRFSQLAKLKLLGVIGKSPNVAKSLNIGGKVATGTLTAAYAGSVVQRANNELRETGKVTDTTADLIRELLLFQAGAKLGESKKLSKIIALKEKVSKLPKSQQARINNQIDKLKKLSEREFGKLDVGLVTQLESQQIVNQANLKGLLGKTLKQDVITLTKNKLFVVKKGNIPKKTGTFNVEVFNVKLDKTGKLIVARGFKQSAKARFNPRTGRVEILKVNKFDEVNPSIIRNQLSRFRKGQKEVVKVKEVPVKEFVKKVVTKKKVEIKPIVEVKPKKVKAKLEIIPLVKKVKVKPTKRKVKEVVGLELKATEKVSKVPVKETGEVVSITEFKLAAPTPRVKKPKPIKKVPVKPKFDELVIIGEKGALIAKKVKPEVIPKPKAVKKPVVKVDEVKVGDEKLKLFPIPKPKEVVKPRDFSVRVKEPVVKPKLKPRLKPKVEIKPIKAIKPIIKVLPLPVKKAAKKPVIKPEVKVDVIPKTKPDVNRKPKIVAKPIKPTVRKTFIPKFPKIKPLLPFVEVDKKPKKKIVKFKKPKKKQILTEFTPTLTSPKKRRKDEELQEFFTGLELR